MSKTKKLLSLSFIFAQGFANSLFQSQSYSSASNSHSNHQSSQDLQYILEDDNPLCARWNQDKCLQCAPKSYFNEKGICVQVDPYCKNFDEKNKRCTSCYPGYQLYQFQCVVSRNQSQNNWTDSNPLCAQWNNGRCTKCSPKSYFNSERICIMVSPDCKTFSQANGFCLSCFDGYTLDQDGRCLKSNDNGWRLRNPLCSQWSSNGNCRKCSARSYRNNQGICIQVDPNCNTFNNQSGQCLSCYSGYNLNGGRCLQTTTSFQQGNPYCSKWDRTRCVRCADRSYFSKNDICTPVSPQCRTYSQNTGQCTSCYSGFELNLGKCVKAEQRNQKSQSNPLCSQWQGRRCVKCSTRAYFNNEGFCVMVDPNCNTYNQKTGECITCYPGYQVDNGRCIVRSVKVNAMQSNPLCGVWSNQRCVKCSPRSYFQQNGICVQVDPYCKDFSYQKKVCEKCYSGYRLRKDTKRCSLPWQQQSSPKQQVICPSGTYRNKNGNCISYDTNCQSFNQRQQICNQCYGDFIAIGSRCLKMQQNLKNFDTQRCVYWRGGQCVQCSSKLSKNQSGLCTCL